MSTLNASSSNILLSKVRSMKPVSYILELQESSDLRLCVMDHWLIIDEDLVF